MIFKLIDSIISLDLNNQFNLQTIDFYEFVQKVVPKDFWSFIFSITRTSAFFLDR